MQERVRLPVLGMQGALEIAKACPFLDVGGSLKVSELVHMPF